MNENNVVFVMEDLNITNNNEEKEENEEETFIRYIRQHSQKITEAIYRITDLFPEKEPLKWLLRDKSMEIFNCAVFNKNESFHQKTASIDKIFSEINRIIYLLEVACAGSFISSLNFEVIKREYLILRDFIKNNSNANTLQNKALIMDIGFNSNGHVHYAEPIGHIQMSDRKHEEPKKISTKIKDNAKDAVSPKHQALSAKKEKKGVKKSFRAKRTNEEKKAMFLKLKQSRESQIIDFIKSKNKMNAGLKEIMDIFKDMSSKTIQRDIKKLVNEGLLKEHGRKRWRKYELI